MIWRRRRLGQARLPEPVFVELIDLLYSDAIPIAIIGVALTAVGAFAMTKVDDPLVIAFTCAGAVVAVLRLGVLFLYRLRRGAKMAASLARRWEIAYAVGSWAFALCVGCLGARVLAVAPEAAQIMAAALLFGYCAGQAARICIRPAICVVSLLLAALPIIGGYLLKGDADDAVIGVFLLLFLAASLETVAYGARTAVALVSSKQQLAALARRDHLTGLPNRMALWDSIDAAILGLGGSGRLVAVHCLDLDRFKAVNDELGHAVGDALLKAVAARLQASIRPEDVAIRLGGDEFVLVQVGIANAMAAEMLARRVVGTLGEPFTIEGLRIGVGVSVGIAMAPKDGATIEDLMERADQALYVAKRQGRNRFKFVDDLDQAAANEALVAAWRRA